MRPHVTSQLLYADCMFLDYLFDTIVVVHILSFVFSSILINYSTIDDVIYINDNIDIYYDIDNDDIINLDNDNNIIDFDNVIIIYQTLQVLRNLANVLEPYK
jgi:hypothetical protein